MTDDPYSGLFGEETPGASTDTPIHQDFRDLASKYGAQITSLDRTPEHNAAVGGVPNSQHLRGTAGDFVVPPSVRQDFIAEARSRGFQPIDEGTHVHVQLPHGGSGGSGGGMQPDPYASLFSASTSATDDPYAGLFGQAPVSAPTKPIQATAQPQTDPFQALFGIAKELSPFTPGSGPINPKQQVASTETEPTVGSFLGQVPMGIYNSAKQGISDAADYFRNTPKEQILSDVTANSEAGSPFHASSNFLGSASHSLGEAISGAADWLNKTGFAQTEPGKMAVSGMKLAAQTPLSFGATPDPTFVGRVQQAAGAQTPALVAALSAPELDVGEILPTLKRVPGLGKFIDQMLTQSPRAGVMTLAQIAQNPNMTPEDIQKAALLNVAAFGAPTQINSPNAMIRGGSAAAGGALINEVASRLQGQAPSLESDIAMAAMSGAGALSHAPEVSHVEPNAEVGHASVDAGGTVRPAPAGANDGAGAAGREEPPLAGGSAEAPVSVKPHVVYRDGQWVPAERTPFAHATEVADTLNQVNKELADRNLPPLSPEKADDMIRAIDRATITGVANVDETGTGDRAQNRDGTQEPATAAAASGASSTEAQAGISTKDRMMQAARLARGEEPLPTAVTPTKDELAATAAEAMRINPNLPHEIIARKLAGDTTISPQEEAVLQRHAVDLTNQMADQARLAADPATTPEARDIAQAKHDDLAQQFDALNKATKITGRSWSDAGRQRMQQLLNDYTFENLVRRKQAGLQRPLTTEETNAARATADKAKNLQAAIDANEQSSARERANEDSLKAYSQMAKALAKALGTERKSGLSAVAEGIHRRAAEARQFLASADVPSKKGQSGAILDPRALYHLANIGAEHILNGFSKFGDWLGKMKDDLGERFSRLMPTRQDQTHVFNAAKAIHDEAKRQTVTPDELRVKQLEKRLADLQAGKQRAGRMQGPDTVEEAALKRQIGDIHDRNRILRQMDELRSKIATQDFASRGRNTKALSDANMQLKYQLQKLKNDFTDSLIRDRFAKMGVGEKLGNFILGVQRAMILSHITTIGKLVSAATQRIAFDPIEDIAGSALNAIPGYKSKISSGAQTEGSGFSPRAYLEGIKHVVSPETIREMGRLIAEGQSKLDVLHSLHRAPSQYPYLDYAARLHAVLKSPAKINAFYSSLAKQVAAERSALMKQGVSAEEAERQLQQPDKMAQMQAKAMEKGKRAILMQDNAFSNWFNSALESAARTGKIGKVGSFIGHALVPIVKIPSNFLTEVGSHVGGALPATYRVVEKGISNLDAADKDFIARNLKKQTVGLGLLALGYLGSGIGVQAGGYYDKTHQPKPGEPVFGGMKLFGMNIPRFLVHSPQLEMLQIGATLRRYVDSTHRNEHTTSQKAQAATIAIGRGLAEETPALETAMNLSQASESPKAMGNFAGREASSFFEPGFMQDIAKWMDTKQRKPQGFSDSIKMGIPGLRQQVPTPQQAKARQDMARMSGGR